MEQFRELIEGLALPTQEALHILNDIKGQPIAWDLAEALLNSESQNCRFYGALTLKHKIQYDMIVDFQGNEEKSESLKIFLLSKLSIFTQEIGIPDRVLNKLSEAIIAYILRKKGDSLKDILEEVIRGLESLRAIDFLRAEFSKLTFLTILPEEYMTIPFVIENKGAVRSIFNEYGRTAALEMINRYLTIPDQPIDSNFETLRVKALYCLNSWLEYGLTSENTIEVIKKVILNFQFESTFSKCVEVLMEAINSKNNIHSQGSIYNFTLEWLVSEYMQEKVFSGLRDNDSDLCQSLIKLYTSFGEAYCEYLMNTLVNELGTDKNYASILFDIILALTNYPGIGSYEQDITSESFEFWALLIDIGNDYIPYNSSVVKPEEEKPKQEIQRIFTRLADILHAKASYPSEEEILAWSKTDHSNFTEFRFNVGHLLEEIYFVLGLPYLAHYIRHANISIETLADRTISRPDLWQDLEATLFLIRKVGNQTLGNKIMPLIEELFSEKFFLLMAVEPGTPFAFQNKYIKNEAFRLSASYVEYYKANDTILNTVIQQLINSFKSPEFRDSATLAFRKICDSANVELAKEVSSLTEIFKQSLPYFSESDLKRMIESVSNTIASSNDPLDHIAPRIESITSFVVDKIRVSYQEYLKYPSDAAIKVIAESFELLSYSCKGLRSASYYGDADLPNFPVTSPIPFTENVFMLTSQILETMGNIDTIALNVTLFLNDGLKVLQIPSPFSFPFDSMLQLIAAVYSRYPNSSYLMVVSQLIITYGNRSPSKDNPLKPEIVRPFTNICSLLIQHIVGTLRNAPDVDDFQDTVSAFCGLLVNLLTISPHSFFLLSEQDTSLVLEFIIIGMSSKLREIIQAMNKFMVSLFNYEIKELIYYEDLNREAQPKLKHLLIERHGYYILEKYLKCAGGELPRSYIGVFSESVRHLIRANIEECKPWFTELMSRENFPSPYVSLETKTKAMTNFLMVSVTAMKFKFAFEDFGASCWNLKQQN